MPCFTKPKVGKTDRRRGVGERTRKRVKCILVVEAGTEVDVGMGPVKKPNKGGSSFQDVVERESASKWVHVRKNW